MSIIHARTVGGVLLKARLSTRPTRADLDARLGKLGPTASAKGLTQPEAAKRAGLSTGQVWRKREKGPTQPGRAGELLSLLRGEQWQVVKGVDRACAGPAREIWARLLTDV